MAYVQLMPGVYQGAKPIETVYKGFKFRSRLEARWAVFLDVMRIEWEYEKDGYDLGGDLGYYLPDFWLPYPDDLNFSGYPNAGHWLEIKGMEPTYEEQAKMQALSMLTKHSGIIVYGLPGDNEYYWTHHSSDCGWSDTVDEFDGKTSAAICFSRFTNYAFMNVEQAIKQARQARFEYGETPA